MSRLIVMSKLWAENRSSDCEGFLSRTCAPAAASGTCNSLSMSETYREKPEAWKLGTFP